jgi:hypothetical protein
MEPTPPINTRDLEIPMNGMTVYDIVRIERQLALRGANPRFGAKVERQPRERRWRAPLRDGTARRDSQPRG